MYVPPPNSVEAEDAVAMIRAASFGHLVSMTDSGLVSTGLPVLIDMVGTQLVLHAHLARANPHWKSLQGAEALVIFPVTDAYVSPAWYRSKADDPRVVPTWNYEVVHVHGTVAVHDDPTWTREMVTNLTNVHERNRHDHDDAPEWAVSDAPDDFVSRQLRAIVGIEIAIDRIEAKRKLSQNRSADDREGVIEGLESQLRVEAEPVAAAMARDRQPSPALTEALAQMDALFAQQKKEKRTN